MQAMEQGIEATTEQFVQLVKEDLVNETKSLYGNLPPEQVEQMLGEDVSKKVVQGRNSKLNKPANRADAEKTNKIRKTRDNRKKKLSIEEFKDQMERAFER